MSVVKHGGQGCDGHCCLKIEHLGVKIDGEDILKDVNLHIHCREIIALIGPNGRRKIHHDQVHFGTREYAGKITFQPAGSRAGGFALDMCPRVPALSRENR